MTPKFSEALDLFEKCLEDLAEAKRKMAECWGHLVENEVYLKESYFWKNYKLEAK